MKLIQRAMGRRRSIATLEDYAKHLQAYMLGSGVTQTMNGQPAETIANSLTGYAMGAYASNGPVFALVAVRMLVFSSIRFAFQAFSGGRPSRMFRTPSLELLDRPWPGGTTQDLLTAMILDIDLAGNAYLARVGDELIRLRPDWVSIVMEPRSFRGGTLGHRRLGYLYEEGGIGVGGNPVPLMPDEVAHVAPYPDPLANYRGMSWLTPVIRELGNDRSMLRHQAAFLANAAPQPLDAKILTPSGWTTMGAMAVGGKVIGSDGRPHTVTGVYPQGEQEIYRVEFTDGGSTECTPDHLWTVACAYDRQRGVTRTLPLRDLIGGDQRFDGMSAARGGLKMPSGGAKWAVPMVGPVEFEPQGALPLDPYLLGLLLGDGSFRGNRRGGGQHGNVTLACAREDANETADRIAPLLPDGVSISRRDRGGWSEFYFRGPPGPFPGPLKEAIRDLGLWGKGSREKFIPSTYMHATVKDRISLLQGLIDSDGGVDLRQPNLVRYTTNSDQLARGAVELVNSLGGLAKAAQYGNRDRWTVIIKRLPDEIIPARLLRKASRYQPSQAPRWRTIAGVTPVGVKHAQCIKVDADDHLYVTDDYVLTHNTPNMIVSLDAAVTLQQFKDFKEAFNTEHKGADNAYKTLFLGGGADATVVGADFAQMKFTETLGRGETRLASAAGVPVTIAGFSEGLHGSSLNQGNYGQARRRFADGTMHPLWQNGAGSLQTIFPAPDASSRLWYDARDVPFLREDAKDSAEIMATKASSIRQLGDGGWDPGSARDAVDAEDLALLEHSGLLPVQVQPPGENDAPDNSAQEPDNSAQEEL